MTTSFPESPDSSRAGLVGSFVAAINDHDVEAICRLMSEDFIFADSLGRVIKGREVMRGGWAGYFRMFPDYRMSIDHVFEADEALALFGNAQGTFSKDGQIRPENYWQVPAAWKAVVRGSHIAEWRVYADNFQTVKLMRAE
jgi:ketosteroid isomerase-like protein